jgi:hypothetical protein
MVIRTFEVNNLARSPSYNQLSIIPTSTIHNKLKQLRLLHFASFSNKRLSSCLVYLRTCSLNWRQSSRVWSRRRIRSQRKIRRLRMWSPRKPTVLLPLRLLLLSQLQLLLVSEVVWLQMLISRWWLRNSRSGYRANTYCWTCCWARQDRGRWYVSDD